MATAKDEVRRLLDRLPDDVSLEDIQYYLHAYQKIARGLADTRAGRPISQAEVESRLSRWLDEPGPA